MEPAAHRCSRASDGSRSSCSSRNLQSLGAIQLQAHVGDLTVLADVLRITRVAPMSASANEAGSAFGNTIFTVNSASCASSTISFSTWPVI